MKIAVCNDLHLDHASPDSVTAFYDSVRDLDAVIIAGDISTAPSIFTRLKRFHKPVYFVLGNHDAYHGSIYEVREQMEQFPGYLPVQTPVRLGDTELIGVDNWCDGRLGDYVNSDVRLNDFVYIAELQVPYVKQLWMMQFLADAAADNLRDKLAQVTAKKLIIVCHVPPFEKAAKHHGHSTDPYFMPFYTCKVVGDVLLKFATEHPDTDIFVACGHTHGYCDVQILPNLRVHAGSAEYGWPTVKMYLEL